MKIHLLRMLFIAIAGFAISGCSYKKGASYYYAESGDTLKYIIRNKGRGQAILNNIEKKREIHEKRQDEYRFVFISDSLDVIDSKSVLLSHSEMPDYEIDMITKGYLGAFGTKEVVTYLIVTFQDFDRYFIPENQVSEAE